MGEQQQQQSIGGEGVMDPDSLAKHCDRALKANFPQPVLEKEGKK